MSKADITIGDSMLYKNNNFRSSYLAGSVGTYTGTQEGAWRKELTDTDKIAEAKTSIETVISNLTVSNETTAQIILTNATNATLHNVNVAWDNTNGFNKTNASTTEGSITGILNLTLNGASDTVNVSKTIALSAINIPAIQGVTAPVNGATPVTIITETAQYTGTVTWSPADATFAASTIYTATITLTPKAGYTLTGVAENFFTAAGVTGNATNNAEEGIITAAFEQLPSLFTFEEGTGTITDYSNDGPKDVVIPSTIGGVDVVNIRSDTFNEKQLTSVTIPDSVTSIGEDAFRSNSLATIIIPDSVSSIGSRAFHANQLTSIKMSKADITIGDNMLTKNNNFRSSYLAGGVGTYTGTQTGTWTKEHTDTDKLAEAKTSIETAISNLTVSNETTAQTILTNATNATLHDVNVEWDDTNSFNKTKATSTTAGAITGTVNLTLNGASDTVNVSKTIAQLPSSGGSSSSGRDDSTPIPQVQEKVFVIVNGKEEEAGTEAKSEEEGKRIVTIAVNSEAIDGKIEDAVKNNTEGSGNTIQVPVSDTESEVAKVELTGDIVKKLEDNTFDVSIKRDTIEYIIPAEQFTISKVAENLGISEKDLADIKVEVKITNLNETVVKKYNEVAKANGAELVFPPVEFEIVAKTTKTDGTTEEVEISKFSNYVERIMKIPEGVDQSKITTGIVFNPDGTYSHVPTEVFFKDGKWYAKLNSLTNSNYAVIWHAITVESVENHWAKDAVNDMASRLVIFNPEKFEPNKAITRGDFAEYIVRALGLYREETIHENKFIDVSSTGERTLAILVASEYGIVCGYTDGTFKPDELITREEAMTMYQRAMKMTKLTGMDSNRYQNYKDFEEVSHWATSYVKEVLAAHVFNGTSTTTISPKLNITYAEAAQGIKNLLVESKLINN
ncbi:hypothetical protein J2Z76_002782 [Sedimentibacter acidaminivorans]|uniref:SLH domain-containing protein n=2 Tax=Sedimentibacter acidaminivorans TaxID=913099 RepID=A0ABS4GHR1_9FIRM|nr:hypothetical protein [Sedimentibacter acidaminivorans]